METTLTDAQTAKILRAFPLPTEAETVLKDAVRIYFSADYFVARTSLAPHQIQERFHSCQVIAANLYREFQNLIADPAAVDAFIPRQPGSWTPRFGSYPDVTKHPRLECVLTDLPLFVNWFAEARGNVEPGRRGPRADRSLNVELFIDTLADLIDEHLHQPLTRSAPNLAAMKHVFAVIDPDVGMETIEEAMKRCIKRRRKSRLSAA